MSKPKQVYPDLNKLDVLDKRIAELGAHYVAAPVNAEQPKLTHDAAHVNLPQVTVTHPLAMQSTATLPSTTHGSRVRVTGYINPTLAGEVRDVMAALDRSESWVIGTLVAEALAARRKVQA